jgi:hypothetical protein
VRFTENLSGKDTIDLGKVKIYEDKDATWNDVLKIERPAWFNCFCNFPEYGSNTLDTPCRGSIIIAANENADIWLRRNHKKLTAVLYFLGDSGTNSSGYPTLGAPAERFHNISIDLSGHDLVSFATKQGNIIENAESLKVTPPLSVRSQRDTYHIQRRISGIRTSVEKDKLIEMLFDESDHRMITACYHYFMSQYSDPLTYNFDRDMIHFSSCLEAVFDVKKNPKMPPTVDIISDHLVDLYCYKDEFRKHRLKILIEGMYACRSIYAHGLSGFSEKDKIDPRYRAYEEFARAKGMFSIVKAICYDAIRHRLRSLACHDKDGSIDNCIYWYDFGTGGVAKTLNRLFYSNDIWADIKKHIGDNGQELGKILLEKHAYDEFQIVTRHFSNEDCFDWNFIEPLPKNKKIIDLIKTCLCAAKYISKERNIDNEIVNVSELNEIAEMLFSRKIDLSEKMMCKFFVNKMLRIKDNEWNEWQTINGYKVQSPIFYTIAVTIVNLLSFYNPHKNQVAEGFMRSN